MAWLECVPNVSEGRDRSAVDRLAVRLTAAAGVRLLDVHCDADHHRSVFTMIGEGRGPDGRHPATCAPTRSRPSISDGMPARHPRIGAVDVVPFVPLGDDDDGRGGGSRPRHRRGGGASASACRSCSTRRRPPRRTADASSRCAADDSRDSPTSCGSRSGAPTSAPTLPIRRLAPSRSAHGRLLVAYNINLATERLDIGAPSPLPSAPAAAACHT